MDTRRLIKKSFLSALIPHFHSLHSQFLFYSITLIDSVSATYYASLVSLYFTSTTLGLVWFGSKTNFASNIYRSLLSEQPVFHRRVLFAHSHFQTMY